VSIQLGRSGNYETSLRDHGSPARACGWAFGDAATDERELTQLINDLNAAIVKPDMAFLERVLDKDYSHYRPHGNVENRA